jgi:mono/diheme cytochrome c family protein
MGWPFRSGTALGIGVMVLLTIVVAALMNHAAQGQLPVGYSEPGAYVFDERCGGCHGSWGEGGEGPALVDPAYGRDVFDNSTMVAAIQSTHGATIADLTKQETADIIAFVRDLQTWG